MKHTRAQDAVVKLEKPGKRKMTFAAVKDAKRRKNLCDLDNLDKKHKQGLLLVDIELSFETSFFFTECIDLTSIEADKPIAFWIKDLQLYEADKQSLSDGKWLTDNIIDAAQALLRQAHPLWEG